MPTTPNMSLVLPTEGGDADIWDTLLNSVFTLVDSHDHTTGKGVKVPSAALKINADVSWAFGGSSFAITDAKALDFAAVTTSSVSALAGALFVNSADNELYFRSVAGTNIKITSGTTLNVSIVGGIGGDYASVGALLDYDDATDTYRARQELSGGVRQFAKFSIADLIIREYDPAGDVSVPANTITIKSPDALGAGYSLTLLTALPTSGALLAVNSTGQVSVGGTFDTPAADAIQVPSSGAHSYSGGRWVLGNSATDALHYPVSVRAGDTITSYSLHANKASDATNELQTTLSRIDAAGGSATIASANNNANAPGLIAITPAPFSHTVVAGSSYFITLAQTDATPSAVDGASSATVTKA